ncbi:MAG: YidC/Oxa1 family membrane protein insertase [Patescibacteria group bacterium]|jgi:YidC/Oxa1 family membrane protein insertase
MINLIINAFNLICYQPLLNLLVFVYNIIPGHDIGLVIITLTLLIKLALYLPSRSTIKAQQSLQELQPKIDEMKEKYKDDKERQAKEMMNLYKEHKINPLSSCLPLLIQLPFLIAIYQVFNTGLRNGSLSLLYPFIANPGHINSLAFGFLDMAKPQWILAVLAGAAQYWQASMMIAKRPAIKNKDSKDEDMSAIMSRQMTIMMPLMTIVIGWSLPSGLVFYWLLLTVFTSLQQLITKKKTITDKAEVINN